MKFYEDLKGCKAGHVPTQRYYSSGNCVQCHKQRYAERMKLAHPGGKVIQVNVPHDQVQLFYAVCKAYGWIPDLAKVQPPQPHQGPIEHPLQHLFPKGFDPYTNSGT